MTSYSARVFGPLSLDLTTLNALADLATVAALSLAVAAIGADFVWRRRTRARELVDALSLLEGQRLQNEVREVRIALGVTDEAVDRLSRAELIDRWAVILDEIYAVGDREKLKRLGVLTAFHNLLEAAADGYLSGSADRRILAGTLDRRFILTHDRKFAGFYAYYVRRDEADTPPRKHGYAQIERLVTAMAAGPPNALVMIHRDSRRSGHSPDIKEP